MGIPASMQTPITLDFPTTGLSLKTTNSLPRNVALIEQTRTATKGNLTTILVMVLVIVMIAMCGVGLYYLWFWTLEHDVDETASSEDDDAADYQKGPQLVMKSKTS